MSARGAEFAQLAHRILILERRHTVEAVAERLGWDYHVLHARVSNRVPFSADEICRFIAAVPDPRLAAYLLRGTRFIPAERIDEAEPEEAAGREAIYRASHRMIVEAADVVEALDEALRDGRIDHREAAILHTEIEAAERALASLKAHVRRIAG